MEQTTEQLLDIASKLYDQKDSAGTIALLPDDVLAQHNNAVLYTWRGLAYGALSQPDLSLADYSKAIDIDKNYTIAYFNRGLAWYDKKEYDKAIDDYTKAIATDKNYKIAYYNRGLAFFYKEDYDNAIKDYTESIHLDPDYAFAYYNRALVYSQKGDISNAINDYEQYIRLANNPEDYWTVVANTSIKDLLNRTLSDPTSNSIPDIVAKIKKLLLFQDECITHYTGLSAAKAMILADTGSLFRLSEGSFLNDTSEGRVLNAFLNFSGVKEKDDDTLAKVFGEKPFIGSYVNDKLSDDLTLWRMYGKEDRTEAKGCSLTINKNAFLTKLKDILGINQDTGAAANSNSVNTSNSVGNNMQTETQFTFYKVAYITKDTNRKFIIPGSEENESELSVLINQLDAALKVQGNDPTPQTKKLIDGIAYLFKTIDYQYEKEVRLVVEGAGFDKKIDSSSMVPRVYIELIDISSVLSRITLGPKVENADEWAAAFHYQIQKKIKNSAVEIVISHLPFK